MEREVPVPPRVMTCSPTPAAPGADEDDTTTTTLTRCSSDCLSHDITVLEPLCVAPTSTLNNLPAGCSKNCLILNIAVLKPISVASKSISAPATSLASADSFLGTDKQSSKAPDDPLASYDRSMQVHRYITNYNHAYLIGDVSCRITPVHYGHEVFEEWSDQMATIILPSLANLVDSVPWPPPVQSAVIDDKVQLRPIPWPSFCEYSVDMHWLLLNCHREPVKWKLIWVPHLCLLHMSSFYFVCNINNWQNEMGNLIRWRTIQFRLYDLIYNSFQIITIDTNDNFKLDPSRCAILWLLLEHIFDLDNSMILPSSVIWCIRWHLNYDFSVVCASQWLPLDGFVKELPVIWFQAHHDDSIELKPYFLFCGADISIWMKIATVNTQQVITLQKVTPVPLGGFLGTVCVGVVQMLFKDAYPLCSSQLIFQTTHLHSTEVLLSARQSSIVPFNLDECCRSNMLIFFEMNVPRPPSPGVLLDLFLSSARVNVLTNVIPAIRILVLGGAVLLLMTFHTQLVKLYGGIPGSHTGVLFWTQVQVTGMLYPVFIAVFLFSSKMGLLVASVLQIVTTYETRIRYLQAPWDPGGICISYRLGGKPNFKKGGMLDIRVYCGYQVRQCGQLHLSDLATIMGRTGPSCLHAQEGHSPCNWLYTG